MQDISGGSAMDAVGCENLQAMEVETGDAVDRFRAAVSGFRAEDLGLGGVAEDVLSQLGLDEFADILDNTPPGLDELLALAEVLALVRSEDGAPTAYDRIIFDTAPTGHTLRLLAFPEFIDSLLGKLLALKSRLAGALSLLKGLLGAGAADPADKLELAVDKLQLWRSRMENLKQLLTDEEVTDFVVVGIPSRLAVAECARLLAALVEQEIPVRHLIVNQVVDQGLDVEKQRAYLDRISAEQSRTLSTLERLPLSKMGWARVPFYDLAMRGVYPLRFLGSKAFGEDHAELWERILSEQRERFVLVGGKGGVGKTTTSAALAVACAENLAEEDDPKSWSHLRVATKYPHVTAKHFANRGVQAECIKLNGAMELAPDMGLCRRIVDLVETGSTLVANGLVEVEHIADISSRFAVNRAAFKTSPKYIGAWVERIREASKDYHGA